MEVKNLESWDDFEKEAENLILLQEKVGMSKGYLLFRGQADSRWHLKTTLERSVGLNQRMIDYYRLITSSKSTIETFTNKTWPIDSIEKYDGWLRQYDPLIVHDFPAREYFVYLRHYGFPSPLLDWSMSPYIAAYFAFRDTLSKTKSVSIFAYYQDFSKKTDKKGWSNITRLGHNVVADKRNYLQQSNYTICTKIKNKKPCYVSHEEAFRNANEKGEILLKFVIPASERIKVLRKLEMVNINSYSLLGSEESLMETEFLRGFVLK